MKHNISKAFAETTWNELQGIWRNTPVDQRASGVRVYYVQQKKQSKNEDLDCTYVCYYYNMWCIHKNVLNI